MNARVATRLSKLLQSAGILKVGELFQKRRTVIFALHRVLPAREAEQSYNPHITVEQQAFEMFVQWLLKFWRIVSLPEAIESLRKHGENCCALTFDDGWEDNYRIAFPILRSYGVPATIFVPTGYVGTDCSMPEERLGLLLRRCTRMNLKDKLVNRFRELVQTAAGSTMSDSNLPLTMKGLKYVVKLELLERLESEFGRDVQPLPRHLGWHQMCEMETAGVIFGSHTVNHCLLAREDDSTVRQELRSSMETLHARLRSPLDILAYPNGDFDQRVINIARDLRYTAAVTTQVGAATVSTDLYRLPRVPIDTAVLSDQYRHFSAARARVHILHARSIGHNSSAQEPQ